MVNISIKFNFSNGGLYITELNDVLPQIAQFYNERISADPILVAWQSTVNEPTEDGFKKRPKHVGVKC